MGFSRVYNAGVPGPPPGRLRARSFLLLFTALGDGTVRLVQARRSVMHVLTVKHNGFERSNAPIPPVAQIRPGTPNGPEMDPKWTPNGPQMDPKWTLNGPQM